MYLDTFTRLRAEQVPAPNNPDRTVADWENPTEHEFDAYWEEDSSRDIVDAIRKQTITVRTLHVPAPVPDIKRGDRIVSGDAVYTVQGFPHVPKNPFTGWAPYLLVTVMEGVG